MLDENALRAVLSDLEDKKTLAQMELNEEKIDYNDLLTQIRMLAQFGARIDRYWEIATFDQRRDILGSMFTNVPTYKNYELTNMEISPLYEALRDISKNHVLNGRGDRTRYELFSKVLQFVSELQNRWMFLPEFFYCCNEIS